MTDIDLSTSTPPSPARTLKLAGTLAEVVRCLNHATRDHEALEYPAEAHRLVGELSSAAERTPQLLSQVGGWLEREQAAGRIGTDDGTWHAAKVTAARVRLDRAAQIAAELHEALDFAASAICHLTAVREDDDDDD